MVCCPGGVVQSMSVVGSAVSPAQQHKGSLKHKIFESMLPILGAWAPSPDHSCCLLSISLACSWQLITINPGIVFGPVATPKLAQSLSVLAPIVEHMNGKK